MSDISKCAGNGCDLREECYRFTAPACEYRQSWIIPPAVGEACEYRLPVSRTVAQQPLGDDEEVTRQAAYLKRRRG